MTNQYRAIHPSYVALHGKDVLELDLSPTDEADAVNSGHFEQVPRPYRVLSHRYIAGNVGDVFEATFPRELEEALIAAGHIERCRRDAKPTVEPDPDPTTTRAAKRAQPPKE